MEKNAVEERKSKIELSGKADKIFFFRRKKNFSKRNLTQKQKLMRKSKAN